MRNEGTAIVVRLLRRPTARLMEMFKGKAGGLEMLSGPECHPRPKDSVHLPYIHVESNLGRREANAFVANCNPIRGWLGRAGLTGENPRRSRAMARSYSHVKRPYFLHRLLACQCGVYRCP